MTLFLHRRPPEHDRGMEQRGRAASGHFRERSFFLAVYRPQADHYQMHAPPPSSFGSATDQRTFPEENDPKSLQNQPHKKKNRKRNISVYKNKAYYWLSWMAQVEESGGLGRTNPVRSKLDIPSRWITFFLPNVAKLAVIISHSTGTETHITSQHYKSRIHFKMERNQNNNSKLDFIIVSYWRDLSWI